ncbi:MAG: hypothetical protein PHI57_06125, partial [Bacteroidales bacterium]|nr:hypothetical protein [Bacteroidales bacterium]
MDELSTLIKQLERLMTEHDCIVVPGLGGFVQNGEPAQLIIEKETFIPRGKSIGFNARLTFNDGTLVQSYQESYKLDFDEAMGRIKQAVSTVQDRLGTGMIVSFGNIGTLQKGETGTLQFRSENRTCFASQSYGLARFSYPALAHRRMTEVTEANRVTKQATLSSDREYIHVRIKRSSFYHSVVAAAACLLMLFISKPASELNTYETQEAFLLHGYLSTEDEITSSVMEVATPIVESAEIIPSEIAEAPINEEVVPVQATIENTAPIKQYLVIISSFPNRASAEKWIENHAQGMYEQAAIVEGSGRARVYIHQNTDKSSATEYLETLKVTHPEHSDAWIYATKL